MQISSLSHWQISSTWKQNGDPFQWTTAATTFSFSSNESNKKVEKEFKKNKYILDVEDMNLFNHRFQVSNANQLQYFRINMTYK